MSAFFVSKDQFRECLAEGLGDLFFRAERIYDDFGEKLTYDVTNVLMHARDQGREKTEEVLGILERHYQEHLQFQHPDIRGIVADGVGVNKTQAMFLDICQRVLKLQPVQRELPL